MAPIKDNKNQNVSFTDTIALNPNWTIYADTTYKSQVTEAIEVRNIKNAKAFEDDTTTRRSILGKPLVQDVFWKVRIPLNADLVSLSGLQDGTFYIDDKKVELNNNRLAIPEGGKHLFITAGKSGNTGQINKPLLFSCNRKSQSDLKKWSAFGLEQYTGFLLYENEFSITQPLKNVQLDLGQVSYMAEVWVNDSLIGSRLWAPFTFDITKYARTGKNKVRIKVGNLYLNESTVNVDWNIFIHGKNRSTHGMNQPDRKDFDAGLLGPVQIKLN